MTTSASGEEAPGRDRGSAPATLRAAAETVVWRVAPLVILASTLAAIVLLYRSIPQADYWDHVNWLRGMEIVGFRLADLFRQANEHRIVVPRLVFLLDDALVRSTGILCVAVVALSTAALAALHWRVYCDALDTPVRRRFAAFVIVSLGFLFTQHENFLWENQVQFLFVYLFAALAVWSAVLAEEETGAAAGWRHAGAAASLVVATYSMANGFLAVIPIVLLFAIRRRWRLGAFYAAVGAALLASYLAGYDSPSHHPDPVQALLRLDLVLLHFLLSVGGLVLFIGGLFGSAPFTAGAVAGGVGVAYVLWRALRWLRGESLGQAERFGVLFALFVLGSFALTSLGRAEISVEQGVVSRYQTPVNLFWINVVLLAVLDPRLARMVTGPALLGASAVLAATLVVGQALAIERAASNAARLSLAMDALAASTPDPAVTLASFSNQSVPLAFSDILRREGRSFFTDPTYRLLGARHDGSGRAALPLDQLGGQDATLTPVAEQTPMGAFAGRVLTARLNGVGGRLLGRRAVVTDGCGVVVGFGRILMGPDPIDPVTRPTLAGRPAHLRAYLAAPPAIPACDVGGEGLEGLRVIVGAGG